jgi:predicted small lipoprotein YifL
MFKTIRAAAMVALAAAFAMAACGRKENAETAAPANAPDEKLVAFQAKVADVDEYMKTHDASNTAAAELSAALAAFGRDFDALAAEAGDEALTARCRLASASMALYVESLSRPAEDPEAMNLALEAQEKWRRARGDAAPPV